jgi:RNA polymerase sigma factor (sigma-70 family)
LKSEGVKVSSQPLTERILTVTEWLESPYLARVAARVALQYGVSPQDTPDLLQELRLALWKAGPETLVNVTWIFHTANHKAIDLFKLNSRRCEVALDSATQADSSRETDPVLYRLLRSRAARLPRSLKQYYSLRYEQSLSQREVAKRLGLCRGSVRCLDRRCLRLLRGRLGTLLIALDRKAPPSPTKHHHLETADT